MSGKFLLQITILILVVGCVSAFGQVSLTDAAPTQTVDFESTLMGVNNGTFAGSGFGPMPGAGQLDSDAWETTGFGTNVSYGATETSGDPARGASPAGGVGPGGIRSFTGALAGTASLMIQAGGDDFTPGTITLRIQNTDPTLTMNQLAVSYDLFVNNDQGRGNSFNFSYSTDDSTYTSVAALNYTSPATADALGFVTTPTAPLRSNTITGIAVAPMGYIYLRWSGDDVSGSGSRDEFALDNIGVTGSFITPTAADGTITGRAITARGQGLRNVVITLDGGTLIAPIYTRTNQFGFYQFQDVPVGASYVIQAFSKRYIFENPSRVINFGDSLENEDFISGSSGGSKSLGGGEIKSGSTKNRR